MTLEELALDALRGAAALTLGAILVVALRGASASSRRLVLVSTFVALVALPGWARVDAWLGWASPLVHVDAEPYVEPLLGPAASAPRVEDAASSVETSGAAPERAAPPPSTLLARLDARSAVAALWLLGVIVVAGRALSARWTLARIIRRATPVDLPLGRAALTEAERTLGARARLLSSSAIDVPAAAGILRPVVLVPSDADAWSAERWRHVVLHELAHVRRRDAAWQALAQIGCALHWFNPLVWWSKRRLEIEREGAADERVLATGVRPSAYAETLLVAASGARLGGRFLEGTVAAARGHEVAARIEAIVTGRFRAPGGRAQSAALSAAGLLVALLPGCLGAPAPAGGAREARTEPPVASASPGAPAGDTPLASEVARSLGVAPGDVALTLDARLQAIVEEEIAVVEKEWAAERATAIVLDPRSGRVLALVGPALAKSPITPGSTFKAITMAAALEAGAVTPETPIDCGSGAAEVGGRRFADSAAHGRLAVADVLAVSSNVGTLRVLETLGAERLDPWLARSGATASPTLELTEVAPGSVSRSLYEGRRDWEHVAMGHKIEVPPVQIAAFYAAIASGGDRVSPTLVRSVRGEAKQAGAPERVLSDRTARDLRSMLERSVEGPRSTGASARVDGVRVAGKTGTAELPADPGTRRTYGSFVGFAPADAPRFVILVGAVSTKSGATGGRVAAPAFAKIVARALGQP